MKCFNWVPMSVMVCVLGVNLPLGWCQSPENSYYRGPEPVSTSVVQPTSHTTRVHQDGAPPVPAPEFDPREAPPEAPVYSTEAFDEVQDADEPWTLFPQDGAFKIHGWISGGITANGRNTTGRFNGPVSFNDRHGDLMLNQLYTVIEREIDTECGFDLGGRVDLLFGTDYVFTQSAGLETRRDFDSKWNNRRFYGLAMPQLYAEAGYGDLSVKFGHFYTIIGYETVTAPDNFFYSHAYTMQYAEPFTHTGALATWKANETWTLSGGIVDGWDKFDPVVRRAQFLGGATFSPEDAPYSLAFALVTGHEDGAAPPIEGNRTMYSMVLSYDISDRLQYVLQHDHGIQSVSTGGTAEWYGLNQYLFYTINDCWKAGLRGEWFRDDDGTRVAGVRESNETSPGGHAGNFYQISAGLNWTPTANLIVRPELRWDWFDGNNLAGGIGPYDGRNDMFTAGIDAILMW